MESSINLDVCSELLTKLFASNMQCTIKNFVVNNFSEERLGYLADHLLLIINAVINNNEKRLRFFVKTFPRDTYPIMQKYIKQSDAFHKEIFVYNVLIPKFQTIATFNFAPLCHYIKSDTIILEDLTQQQYQLCKLEQFTETHIELTLETIATVHAASIVYEEKTNTSLRVEFAEKLTDGINRKDKNFVGYSYLQAAHKGLLFAIDFLQYDQSTFKTNLNEIFDDIFTLLTQNATYKNVFNHGDLWPMNILFQYDNNNQPKQCKLVDFQLIRYSPPANDVLYFLLHAMDHDNFKQNLQKYLQFYYKQLSRFVGSFGFNLNSILSLKEFEMTCNLLLAPMKLKHAYQIMLQHANSTSYMKNVYKDTDLYTKCLFEDRSELVSITMSADENYKQIVRELLDDLKVVVEFRSSGKAIVLT